MNLDKIICDTLNALYGINKPAAFIANDKAIIFRLRNVGKRIRIRSS